MTTRCVIAAGLGAASPSLLRLAIGLQAGEAPPEATYVIGLAIFVVLGCLVGWFFDERDLKKAFYTGIGLPALLQLGVTANQRANDPVPAPPPGVDSVRTSASLERSADGAVLRLAYVAQTGPRRLHLVVASGSPDQVRVEFTDRMGARFLTGPAVAEDRVLTFDVPAGATAFRVVVRGSAAEPLPLGADPTDSFRVDVAARRWSGLQRAIGADAAGTYVVRVQPLRGAGVS
jgi:hypothetical protein